MNNNIITGNMMDDDVPPAMPPPVPLSTPIFQSVMSTTRAPPLVPTFHRHTSEKSKRTNLPSLSNQQQRATTAGVSSEPWVWNVPALQCVPMYHPLERGALIVSVPLPTVTIRITNFLRENSVTCTYHSNEIGRIDCFAPNLVKFVVQLWQSDNKSDIIVEVQRRRGCSIAMQQLRSGLYHAIRSGDLRADARSAGNRTVSDAIRKMADIPDSAATMEMDHGPLDIAFDLLNSNCLDQNRLGLESLCALTDPTKVSSQDSDKASREIIFGDDQNNTAALRDVFANYVLGIEEHGGNRSGCDEEYARINHVLSLRILSNAFESITRQKESGNSQHNFSLDMDSVFWRTALEALLFNLKVAVDRPLEAALSLKSIRLLQCLEPSVLASAESRLVPQLTQAYQYGRSHHLWLQQESEQLMGRFGSVHG